jgi:hypothetical protein
MNEKAPEEAERGSALRMRSPLKKVARRPGAERMCPSEYMGPVLDVPLHGMRVRSDGVEHDLVLATPHLKTVRICEFSSAIAAYGLGAKQIVGKPLVRDVRRAGTWQKACHHPTRVMGHILASKSASALREVVHTSSEANIGAKHS